MDGSIVMQTPVSTWRATLVLERFAAGAATLSGALFLLLALFMTGEAVSRWFGGPYSGMGDVITSLVLSLAGSWALAHGITAGSHVRIDVLMPLIPRAVQRWLDAVSMASLAAFGAILAYNAWALAWSSHTLDALIPQSPLDLPLGVPQALTAVGITLFASLAAVCVPLQLTSRQRDDA